MALPRGRVALIAAGVGIVLVAGGAFLAVSVLGIGGASASRAQETPAAEKETSAPGPMYVLKERVINLADPGGRRYIKVAMSIEFNTEAEEFRKASPEERKSKQTEFDKKLTPKVPLIDDAIITLISARTSGDLATPEGKVQLKQNTKEALNQVLGGEQVANVYFTQFVMQ